MSSQLNGIIVIDKPAEMSSAQVVWRVKQILGAKKVGHTGTLDPLATGLLVVCLNQATKIAGFLIASHKTYDAVMTLGIETDTQDATGRITAQVDIGAKKEGHCCGELSEERIKNRMLQFLGPIKQVPPAFSALKHKGVPLYKLAREGRPVRKSARDVTIYELKDVEIDLPLVRFTTTCSAGTYIRTLCADIGSSLGCGAHLKSLRRTGCCGFQLSDAVTLAELERIKKKGCLEQHLKPMGEALIDMAAAIANDELASNIKFGRPITRRSFEGQFDGVEKESSPFLKVFDQKQNLIAIFKDEKKEVLTYCYVFNTN